MGTFGTHHRNVSQNFGYYVLLTELPSYMKNVLNYDLKSKVSPRSDQGRVEDMTVPVSRVSCPASPTSPCG